MADMTRERKEAQEALAEIKEDYWEDDGHGNLTQWCQCVLSSIDLAISDMKRVEELERENENQARLFEQQAEIINNNNVCIAELEKSYLLLKDGIEKVKAEIETLANTDFIPGTFVNGVTECKDIIKKYLGA